jgi:CubicO group peptidase (beta-lactamase class C family)/beta-glucosidase-like glycosyl hydrolase
MFNRSLDRLLCTLLLSLFLCPLSSQQPAYLQYLDHPWVDSVLATLSTEERIAQSVWITTGSNRELSHYVKTDHIIRQHGIGGLIFNQGKAAVRTEWINHYQSVSKVPLAIATDGEWASYPNQMALAAIIFDSLKYQMGTRIARQFRGQGIQVVLAPVRDVNITAALHEHHMLSTGRYFPGPDHTEMDSVLEEVPGFTGHIATDASAMTSLATCFEQGDDNAGIAIRQIQSLLDKGKTDTAAITHRARMILALKYWSGLQPASPADSSDNKASVRDLYKHSLTVLNNSENSIPLMGLEGKMIACIAINHQSTTAFQDMASNYTRTDNFCWYPGVCPEDSLLGILQSYDVIIAGIYVTGEGQDNHSGIPDGMDAFLSSLSETSHLISVYFGDPYDLESIEGLKSSEGLILAYQKNIHTEELAAQLIFGGIGGQGRLPVAISDKYPAGYGLSTSANIRLQYAYPENAGISSRKLKQKIDSVVTGGLVAGAYPGCEVIVARKGMVVFHKTYGYHTFDARIDVQKKDLYDLASVTKVSGPLAGLMLLESMGLFSHTGRLADYCPSMKGSDKANLEIKDILAHQAGLYPWIPYWENTVKESGEHKRRFIRCNDSERYSLQVADRIYLKSNYIKKIYREIKKSALGEKEYVYSGLAFFLFPEIIENLSGEPYEDFLVKNIYHRLGAWDLVFHPDRYYPLSRIVPTELDMQFRKQLVHGYVHDEGAAMMGGYAGNAGLFSTANDLLKLFEMYRRMGNYGGEQLIPEEIMKLYTRYQFPEKENRSGLGFDKPSLGERDGTMFDYPCPGASPSSFGHSGFTGTFAWVDPEHEISYVFLSNRVYPTRENDLIADMHIRTAILQCVYDSIIE